MYACARSVARQEQALGSKLTMTYAEQRIMNEFRKTSGVCSELEENEEVRQDKRAPVDMDVDAGQGRESPTRDEDVSMDEGRDGERAGEGGSRGGAEPAKG